MSVKTDANCAFYECNNTFIRGRRFNCGTVKRRVSNETELKNLVYVDSFTLRLMNSASRNVGNACGRR